MVAFDTKTDRRSLSSTYIFNIKGVETPLTLPLPPPPFLDHNVPVTVPMTYKEALDDSGVDLKMLDDIFFQRTQKIFEKPDAKKYFEPVVSVLTEVLLTGKQSPSKENFRYLGNFLLEKSKIPSPTNTREDPKKSPSWSKVAEGETTNPTMNIDEYIAGLLVQNLDRHLEKKEESTKEKNGIVDQDEIKVVLDETDKTILNDGILALNEVRPTNPLNYLGEYILKKSVVPERERGDPRSRQPCPWNVKTFNSFEYLKNPEKYDQSLSDPTGPWVTVPMTYKDALDEFSKYL